MRRASLLLVLMAACAHANLPAGFHQTKDGDAVRAFADGSTESVPWRSGTVDAGTLVDGVPCAGEVALWGNGHLWYCVPSRDFVSGGVAFSGGDTVDFAPDGNARAGRLARAHVFGAWSCKAGGAFRLYDHGEFRGCDATSEMVVDGVTCAAGASFEVWENGALRACTPPRDEDVSGIPCRGGSSIARAKNGGLVRATLAQAVTFGGLTWDAGVTLEFYDSGMLRRGELRERAIIQGRAFAAGERPCFDAEGRLFANQRACNAPESARGD